MNKVLLLILLSVGAQQVLARTDITAVYSGDITRENNRLFLLSVEAQPVSSLEISSGGGEVDAAIELGYWIHAHDIDVVVTDYCLSSCANYIFPAGKEKIIRQGAVVAWHGNYRHLLETGLWRDEIPVRMSKFGEDRNTATHRIQMQVHRLVALEDAFFRVINLNGYICWFGKMAPYQVPDFYSLSREDMARFGLKGVHVPVDYEKTDLNNFSVDIRFIRTEAADKLKH